MQLLFENALSDKRAARLVYLGAGAADSSAHMQHLPFSSVCMLCVRVRTACALCTVDAHTEGAVARTGGGWRAAQD